MNEEELLVYENKKYMYIYIIIKDGIKQVFI